MRPPTSRAGGPARLLSLVVAGSLVLAACGGSAGAASPPGPSSTSAANPTESPLSSTPTDSTAADRTNVSGRMDGGLVSEDEATSRLYFEFTYTMSDPRVSGTEKIDCTERAFDLPDLGLGAGVGVWWDCAMVLHGQGGTWKGMTGYGSEYMKSHQLHTNGTNIYEGQGAFAGLRYVTLFSGSPWTNALYGEGYVIAGWIEPAE